MTPRETRLLPVNLKYKNFLIFSDEEVVAMQLQCGPLKVEHSTLATLKNLAGKAFTVLERGWKLMDVTLVDFKVTPKNPTNIFQVENFLFQYEK